MIDTGLDGALIQAIAARLDLREPNIEALESIVFEVWQHYEVDQKSPPFEGVVDAATGVGKTYILGAAIEYFAAVGFRNFAVITPGRTILDKTVANFTAGHPKSLLGGMEAVPVVITSENFATATMRAAMDDAETVKLFVFTVQALLKPQTKVGRRTHKFQEGLGAAFYEHLTSLTDLIVFADEHHCYYGPGFSKAVRDLEPSALIGLTATPHKRTPEDQIIFRYPLAAAIGERLVKTPILVGRKDDRNDPETKLLDGVRLLEHKQRALERFCAQSGEPPVNPIMLVIAQRIEDAEEYGRILSDPSFAGGAYANSVLVIHSDSPDQALAALEDVEDAGSPVRIIISVGMLKEGWDVKNVYVIASMRSSVSEILTEQTLGRGLRLPFGKYTDIELLDSLEVLAHERYEQLLKKAGVINEAFVDHRTRAVLRQDAQGRPTATIETTVVEAGVSVSETGRAALGTPVISTLDGREREASDQADALTVQLVPRPELPQLEIPRLVVRSVSNPFSLADITDLAPFARLGERLAADPVAELRRVRLSARVTYGRDGMRRTELVTAPAVDRFDSPATLVRLDAGRQTLTEAVLGAPVVPGRKAERAAIGPIIDAFIAGLGGTAEEILSAFPDRAAAGLIDLITREHRRFVQKPSFEEVAELVPLSATRIGRPHVSRDRMAAFQKGVGYEGWTKSLYAQVWFDSGPERTVANILDQDDDVAFWVRLHRGDLPILWQGGGEYNPDFVVVERDVGHWVIEVKMDKDMTARVVRDKRDAAKRWANHVSADPKVKERWGYLLVSETDTNTAKGSWASLKKLGKF